jgi:hypothetical protein
VGERKRRVAILQVLVLKEALGKSWGQSADSALSPGSFSWRELEVSGEGPSQEIQEAWDAPAPSGSVLRICCLPRGIVSWDTLQPRPQRKLGSRWGNSG